MPEEEGDLDPILHQPTRARIMALLYRNRQAPFTSVRDDLGLTPGNLGAHAARLEEAGYIQIGRVFSGVFEMRYFITPKGAEAFRRYVAQLQRLIETSGAGAPPSE